MDKEGGTISHVCPLPQPCNQLVMCINLPQVRNVIERLKNCCRFFLKSPKRSGLLELIVTHNIVNETKRKPLLDLCKTRWAEQHTAYQHFYEAFVFIVESLKMIGFKRHLSKYGDMYAD